MTIERLDQYRHIQKEITVLERRIADLQSRPDYITADTVVGSSAGNPQQHVITITGYGGEHVAKLAAVEDQYRRRNARLLEELAAIESFIGTLEDSKLRQIIELRYVNGKSWNAVAKDVYGYPNGNRARMSVERFFKKF